MLNLPKFVFINGPAGSGKSTLAGLIDDAAEGGCWRESFAEPIREMIRCVFFPEEGPLSYSFNLKDGSIKKRNLAVLAKIQTEDEKGIYGQITVREAIIDFGEKYMKPRFGDDVFGRLLFKRCQEQETWYSHFIIDDSGFTPEAQYVVDQVGSSHCALLRLHRAGCDFAGDSRGYIQLPSVRSIDLHNDGAAAEMLSALQLEFGNL